jgi:hypothetical protein
LDEEYNEDTNNGKEEKLMSLLKLDQTSILTEDEYGEFLLLATPYDELFERLEGTEYYIPVPGARCDELTNRYGKMRDIWLKENKPQEYAQLMLNGTLNDTIMQTVDEYEDRATELFIQMTNRELADIPSHETMRRIQIANNCKSRADEIAMQEILFS